MTKRVLLCDDEIHILRAAEFKLSRAGFDVHCASDGEQGWQEVLAWRPDILITDCQMPRLDGFGLCRRIREHAEVRNLPILMLTAKGLELSQDEVTARWGVLALLSKPFSPRELVRAVQQALETGHVDLPSTALNA